MTSLVDLFSSPEFYPLKIDRAKKIVTFVRMSQETYRKSVFLDARTQRVGTEVYTIRLDDILLAGGSSATAGNPVHYIFHTAFCCSTLLSRYFELVPGCLVLKEPRLFTQVALESYSRRPGWEEALRLCNRLLSRTYSPGGLVVIKGHDYCNTLGCRLLEDNPGATATFLTLPLRPFIFAFLKTDWRRKWLRKRIQKSAKDAAACPWLADIDPDDLTDAQAVAYVWLVNRLLCAQLRASTDPARVVEIDGERVSDSPEQTLRAVFATCGLTLDERQLQSIVAHPSVRSYSKDLSKPFDASSRLDEKAALEGRLGKEADAGLEWVAARAPKQAGISEADLGSIPATHERL